MESAKEKSPEEEIRVKTAKVIIDRLLTFKDISFIDPFDILNISYNSTDEQIKRKYRSTAIQIHPDKCGLPQAGEAFNILENATFVNEGSNYFKIKGENLGRKYNSENIQLIVSQNGNQKIIPCVGKRAKDNEDDEDYYYLESKGGNYLTNIDFNYAIANFTKNNKSLLLDFKKGEDSIIKETPVFKKSKGLSKGVICAIAIPTILLTLGVTALVFFLSRRPLPPPQPIKNVMNNTVGIASSGVVVNQ